MTLAVVAAFANSRTIIRNVGSWRVKETERMKAIVTELGKLGVKVNPAPLPQVIHLPGCVASGERLLAAAGTFNGDSRQTVLVLFPIMGTINS